jgi:hypothetical protein
LKKKRRKKKKRKVEKRKVEKKKRRKKIRFSHLFKKQEIILSIKSSYISKIINEYNENFQISR